MLLEVFGCGRSTLNLVPREVLSKVVTLDLRLKWQEHRQVKIWKFLALKQKKLSAQKSRKEASVAGAQESMGEWRRQGQPSTLCVKLGGWTVLVLQSRVSLEVCLPQRCSVTTVNGLPWTLMASILVILKRLHWFRKDRDSLISANSDILNSLIWEKKWFASDSDH